MQYTGAGSATLNRAIAIGGVGGGTIRATAATTISTGGINGGGNGVTFDTAGGAIAVTSTISGTGTSVTKVGTSTLTLSGTNTYTGDTIIKEGVLAYSANSANLGASSNSIIFDGGTLRTLAVALPESRNIAVNSNGGTIDNNSTSPSFGGVVSGTGELTLIGTGVTTLSNTNTYTGATIVNAGRLHVTGSLASPTVKVNSTGTLSGNGSILGNVQANGTGNINLAGGGNIAGTLTAYGGSWSGNASVAGLVSVVGGSFTLNSLGNLVAPAGVTVDGAAIAGTGTITGNVSLANNPINYSTVNFGSGGTINGTLGMNGGTAIWAGSGSVTGTTTVSSGALFVNGTMGGGVSSRCLEQESRYRHGRQNRSAQGNDSAAELSTRLAAQRTTTSLHDDSLRSLGERRISSLTGRSRQAAIPFRAL